MPRYEVTLLDGGSLGSFAMQHGSRVEADNEQDAIEQARAKARETFGTTYDRSRARVVPLHRYEIKLRPRPRAKDKRRRETYIVWGRDERDALRCMPEKARVFAGYGITKATHPSVVSINDVTP